MLKRKIVSRLNRHVVAPWLQRGKHIDQIIPLQDLGLAPEEAHEHAPTDDYIELWRLLKTGNVRGKSIVDLGCGSGAAICLFSRLPFSHIWGVELNPRLANTASSNFLRNKRVTIECADARHFTHPVDIVYLFNPFPWLVLEDALKNLLSHGNELRLLYRNPKFAEHILKTTHWECTNARYSDSSTSRYFSATLKAEQVKRVDDAASTGP